MTSCELTVATTRWGELCEITRSTNNRKCINIRHNYDFIIHVHTNWFTYTLVQTGDVTNLVIFHTHG